MMLNKKIKKRIDEQIARLQNWSSKAHADSTKQDEFAKEYYRKSKKYGHQIRSKRSVWKCELAKEKVERPLEEKEY